MSLQFSDTTNYRGLAQMFEREIGVERGYITNNTDRLKEFTADVNLAFDDYVAMAIRMDGRWQFDDSNHTSMPVIYTDLVPNQRDYSFVNDGDGNAILDIQRVFIKPENSSIFQEVYPADMQSDDVNGLYDELNEKGIPTRYDKTGNVISLDPIPSYNSTGGLKIMINREAKYFTHTDTTKKPGVPGVHHSYFYLKPAVDYLRRTGSQYHDRVLMDLNKTEGAISRYYSHRDQDDRYILEAKPVIYE